MAKIAKSNWTICVAGIAGIIGLVFYLVTSMTGFLAGATMNLLPVISTVVALLCAAVLCFGSGKLHPVLADVLVVATGVLLIVGFSFFILGRVSLAADIYFIPVNYPQSEVTAFNLSVVGLAFYLVSILAMIVAGFSKQVGPA